MRGMVRRNAALFLLQFSFFFFFKHDRCAKTGSGQTKRMLTKRRGGCSPQAAAEAADAAAAGVTKAPETTPAWFNATDHHWQQKIKTASRGNQEAASKRKRVRDGSSTGAAAAVASKRPRSEGGPASSEPMSAEEDASEKRRIQPLPPCSSRCHFVMIETDDLPRQGPT
jgi:hypothetical protein